MLAPPIASSRVMLAAVLLAMTTAGCQSDSATNGADAQPFEAMTTGTPEARWLHCERLVQRYGQSVPPDPATSRQMLLSFTSAVIDTTKSILDDPNSSPEIRESAAGAHLMAFARRKQLDPNAVANLMAASRRIEEQNPKSRISVVAAVERARVLREDAIAASEADAAEKYRIWGEEVLYLGQMTPTPPIASKALDELGEKTEFFGLNDLAEKIYRTLAERFPEEDSAKFAKGALHRMSLIGKPMVGLEGIGRDGKTLSTEDFKGKVLLVDFWGTQCKPCLDEIEIIEALRNTLEPKGMALMTVALDPDSRTVVKFLDDAKLDWPVIFSNTNLANMESALTVRFGIKTIPFKILIDREGKLAAMGFRLKDVQPKLEQLLAAESPGVKSPEMPAPSPGVTPPLEKKD